MHDVFHVEKLLTAYGHDWHLFPTADKLIPNDDPVANDLGDYYDEQYEVEKLIGHWYDLKGNLQFWYHVFKIQRVIWFFLPSRDLKCHKWLWKARVRNLVEKRKWQKYCNVLDNPP